MDDGPVVTLEAYKDNAGWYMNGTGLILSSFHRGQTVVVEENIYGANQDKEEVPLERTGRRFSLTGFTAAMNWACG